jgi:hypothetical protein
MCSYVSAEQRVPADHPLRPIRTMMDAALKGLWRSFGRICVDWTYLRSRRKSMLCCCRCCIRYAAGRMLMEQLEYNLLTLFR